MVFAALAVPASACSLLVDRDVGVRADGGAEDRPDAGSSAACGTVGRLQDDFSMDEMLPRWLVSSSGPHVGDPVPVGGKLRVSFLGGVAEDAGELSQAESHFAYDLRGESVSVRVDRVDTAWVSNLQIRVPSTDGMAMGMGVRGSDMIAWTFAAPDSFDTFASVPYDAGVHQRWRIRESGGGLELETAGDQGAFVQLARLDQPGFALDSVLVSLTVASDAAKTEGGFVEFDDFNQGAEAKPACPIADLADPFTTPAPGPLWRDRSSGCDFHTGDGSLVADAQGTLNCQLVSAKAYSIEGGDEIAVEVVRFPGPGAELVLEVVDGLRHLVSFRQLDGTLRMELFDGESTVQDEEVPNDVTGQWWRVRELDGDLLMETSTDGSDYMVRHTFEPDGLIDLAEVRATLTVAAGTEWAEAEIGSINEEP